MFKLCLNRSTYTKFDTGTRWGEAMNL